MCHSVHMRTISIRELHLRPAGGFGMLPVGSDRGKLIRTRQVVRYGRSARIPILETPQAGTVLQLHWKTSVRKERPSCRFWPSFSFKVMFSPARIVSRFPLSVAPAWQQLLA
jgi:hypothetical protein